MFPQNRYVKEREEREATRMHSIPQGEVVVSKTPSEGSKKPETSNPVSLQPVEKKQADHLNPLPGGGFRRLDYEGILSRKDLNLIEKNYPIYKEAERKTGINWKVLAAVHYRESSLGKNSLAKGNEFQFDGDYKKLATGHLLKDAITAGKILQEKNSHTQKTPLLGDEFAGEKVKEAMFRYNGRVYKQSDHSPYVMNQFDDQHHNMKLFLGRDATPKWGTDRRLGAYTVIRELTRAFVA